jgi:hypothetical protein
MQLIFFFFFFEGKMQLIIKGGRHAEYRHKDNKEMEGVNDLNG